MKRIALIGRPNVGKSSLFNALLGHRRAIVYDEPGTTMDLIIESVDWGKLQLMDSQGIFGEGDEVVLAKALEEADAYLFVVDAHVGLTPFDQWIGQLISRQGKPTLLVLNKADGKGFYTEDDFARLGLEETVLSSASHRRGIDLIKEWCLTQVNQELAPHHEKERPIKMALVGRPNSGKSTLMNKLCRKKVSRVSPEPLTTRDPVSFEMEQGGHYIRLVDTAGIRRPRTKKGSIEEFSINAATRTIRASDVVCLLINCNEPITDQDMRLLSLLEREGKPVLVLLNFWDCLNGEQRAHFVKESDFAAYLKNFQTLPISGKTGWQIHKLIPMVVKTAQTSTIRVKTSDLNKFVENVIARNPPPAAGFGNFNILYGSQIKTQPPTFVFFMNRKGNLPDSYRKYLEGKIKQRLGFKGQTVRIFFRAREHRANPG